MNIEEKINTIIDKYINNLGVGKIEDTTWQEDRNNMNTDLTALIQQERESAVREFVGWIQGQAHGYKALVHMPVNQAHIQVREVYELLNQFLQGQNK